MGKYNSTDTRVVPLLEILKEDDFFLTEFIKMLEYRNDIKEPYEKLYYGKTEIGIPPSKDFLIYLIKNLDLINKSALEQDTESTGATYEKRKKLLHGDIELQNEALDHLYQDSIPKKEWYIFEGYTYPDIYIETENYILVGEAKRTESSLTTSTKWLNNRDQLIRHIDSVLDSPKEVLSFFIVDKEMLEKYDLGKYNDITFYYENLSYRDEKKILKAYNSYIGFTTWDILQDNYKIHFPI